MYFLMKKTYLVSLRYNSKQLLASSSSRRMTDMTMSSARGSMAQHIRPSVNCYNKTSHWRIL